MELDNHLIAQNIKKLRQSLNLSMLEFSNKLGYKAASSYFQIEKGKGSITTDFLNNVARTFGVSVASLLGLEDGAGADQGRVKELERRVKELEAEKNLWLRLFNNEVAKTAQGLVDEFQNDFTRFLIQLWLLVGEVRERVAVETLYEMEQDQYSKSQKYLRDFLAKSRIGQHIADMALNLVESDHSLWMDYIKDAPKPEYATIPQLISDQTNVYSWAKLVEYRTQLAALGFDVVAMMNSQVKKNP